MNARIWWLIVFVLFVAIIALSFLLFLMPAPVQAPVTSEGPSATTTVESTTQPLHERVSVSSPQRGATVGHSFLVVGEAPGSWYFEASFPI
ncbi:MAG: hypothetical protein Q8P19_04075, partial [bacterium]|nr:hypothetical protein [bacterium]